MKLPITIQINVANQSLTLKSIKEAIKIIEERYIGQPDTARTHAAIEADIYQLQKEIEQGYYSFKPKERIDLMEIWKRINNVE